MSEPGETIDIDRPSSEHGAPSSGSPGSIDAVGSQTTGVQPGAPDASSAQEHGVGTAIGRFVVLGTLGHGGMGTVYDAFDRTLDRRVAVKVLKPDVAPQQEQRLLREALALAQLSHPNVVQVYEIGEADGRAFVAMELVEGQTLRRWSTADPRPSWRACVEVYLQAGAGLAAAHERGVLHRDFKPSNAV
ncbi:MAG: serine/threonine protein kinase, partial [Deltaproteobacteria bacterium]|nr:serine/threonine protein kinase [Deltaproteobacteria bacterium]